jgi:uncharacterized protein
MAPSPLTCPKCQCELQKLRYGSTEVELCPGCKGLFLDSSEQTGARTTDVTVNLSGKNQTGAEPYQPSLCPSCSSVMRIVPNTHHWFSSRRLIEECPNCSGVWLDQDDFDLYFRVNHSVTKIRLVCPSCQVTADQSDLSRDNVASSAVLSAESD